MPRTLRLSMGQGLAAILICLSMSGCAGTLVRPAPTPVKRPSEALLILPGFGYGPDGERALSALASSLTAEGISVYVPTYISRLGIDHGRERLRAFMREQRLDRYERLHVFAFIAGAWTMNPLFDLEDPPNLATVIYDRSPLQERAPQIAIEKLPLLAWLRYGSPVFDVAKTPYAPLHAPHVHIGLMVETRPTSFVRRHASAARGYGPLDFDCGALHQPYDDCVYLAMSHDDIYVRFTELWPEISAFIRGGRFSIAANRTPPDRDPLAAIRR